MINDKLHKMVFIEYVYHLKILYLISLSVN